MVSFPKCYQNHQSETPSLSGWSRHHRLPLVLPYPTSPFRGFFPSLQVTLTRFALSSYERALRLPSFFLISGLARLEVKPRPCKSSWRAFAPTHPLMLPSTSPMEALFACPFYLPWNPFLSLWIPPSPFLAPALILISLAKMRFSLTLTLSPLTIWCFELTAPFLFVLAKKAPKHLPTALSVASRPLYPFQQAHYAQVSLLNPVLFCKLFAGLGSTNKSATFLLFFFYLTFALSSPPHPILHLFVYLNLTGRSCRKCLFSPPVLSGYNGSPVTCFSRVTTQLMSWPDGERYLCPLQSLAVSLLLSLVSIFIFFRTGGVLFHRNSSTHRFPRFPPRNL